MANVEITMEMERIASPKSPENFLIIRERIGKKANKFTARERNPNTWVTLGSREASVIEASMAQFKEKGEV